jgi:hypothetical protein
VAIRTSNHPDGDAADQSQDTHAEVFAMTKQPQIPGANTTARRMEQGGWMPLMAPIPIYAPPHHHLGPLLAYLCACAAIVALILVLLQLVNGSL